MRILSIQAENFGSYKHINIDMSDRGLTLIQGPTGSGKSTLCDLVPWCLFGTTAKNGTVDEVIGWPGDAVTKCRVIIEVNPRLTIGIERARGKNANDLKHNAFDPTIYTYDQSIFTRGKDLNDTQKLINNLLGIDANLYLSGAYFHEFSTTAQFFTTTAKNRRLICEQIVDLSLAKKLQLKLSDNIKTISKEIDTIESQVAILTSNISLLEKMYKVNKNIADNWDTTKAYKKTQLVSKYDNFERARRDIVQALEVKFRLALTTDPSCPTCGAKTKVSIRTTETSFLERINAEKDKVNPYADQIVALELEQSPHDSSLIDLDIEIDNKRHEVSDKSADVRKLSNYISDLETLEEIADSYRSITIQNAIAYIENNTNSILSLYFDAEIQIEFQADLADKIEVNIVKDGNQCSYTQLSKGQRQLLKLAFGISIMKAISNHSGITFNQIFLDEALDGLDETLKIKAYRLLETLSTEYESVFVVEHSNELKNLFTNKISVNLVNGYSELSES